MSFGAVRVVLRDPFSLSPSRLGDVASVAAWLCPVLDGCCFGASPSSGEPVKVPIRGTLGAGERLSASLHARSVPPVDSDGCSSAATALSDAFSSGAALSFCVALLRDEVEKRRCRKEVFRVVVGDDDGVVCGAAIAAWPAL